MIKEGSTFVWNLLRNKLNLEFSQESQTNINRLNELLLTHPAVVYINHTSKLDALMAVSMVLSQLTNAKNILGPVGMKHYDWRRDPVSAGFLRLLKYMNIRALPIVQVDDKVDYGERQRLMIENLKRETEIIREPGSVYGIVPEGTRSKDGSLLKANKGIGYLGGYGEIFYLPVVFIYQKPAPKQGIILGEPLQLKDIIPQGMQLSQDPREKAQTIANLHMSRLAALMPYSLRGVYGE